MSALSNDCLVDVEMLISVNATFSELEQSLGSSCESLVTGSLLPFQNLTLLCIFDGIIIIDVPCLAGGGREGGRGGKGRDDSSGDGCGSIGGVVRLMSW